MLEVSALPPGKDAWTFRLPQSTGVMAMVKHLAVYNQETNRNTAADNAVVRNQATQEIYLPAFQTAVQQGVASSVMCSYSYINGTAACENPYTLRTVLRQQYGFDAMTVMPPNLIGPGDNFHPEKAHVAQASHRSGS